MEIVVVGSKLLLGSFAKLPTVNAMLMLSGYVMEANAFGLRNGCIINWILNTKTGFMERCRKTVPGAWTRDPNGRSARGI